MHPKFTHLLMASVALVFTASCEQKAKSAAAAETPAAETEEPFVIVPRLVKNDGAFELLAVIDGADANQQFIKNLQIVKAQQMALKQLKDQNDKSDESKKKVEDLEKKLQENTAQMVKLYAYNPASDYIFVPVKSALVKTVDNKKQLIKRLDSPSEHNKLLAMRAKYAAAKKKDGENSAEAQELAKKLMQEFSCDVKSNCEVDVNKGALYRKIN